MTIHEALNEIDVKARELTWELEEKQQFPCAFKALEILDRVSSIKRHLGVPPCPNPAEAAPSEAPACEAKA